MRRMVEEGLIARGNLYDPPTRGQGAREITRVVDRLIRAFRRENMGGRQQMRHREGRQGVALDRLDFHQAASMPHAGLSG
jgi:hypothetical protein